MRIKEQEAIDYLKTKYLMTDSIQNPSKEYCEKHNAVIALAIEALKAQKKLKEKAVTKMQVAEIIAYMNDVCGTSYKANNSATERNINARFKEGFTVEDFKMVIDKKAAEWLGTKFEPYLRPSTLFCTKFESYVNQKSARRPRGDRDILGEWSDS